MSLKTVRKNLKNQLADNNKLQAMFANFLEEKRPTPEQLDAITIKKTGSEEVNDEFGSNYSVSATYSLDIIATMKRNNIEDGDAAQLLADQYIRQAIKADIDLTRTIAWMKIGKTTWGTGIKDNDLYYTIVPVECKVNEDPTDR